MALDVYLTLLMSDEPERVFSDTGNLLTPSRRTMPLEVPREGGFPPLSTYHLTARQTLRQKGFCLVIGK
jgi:hypothetical protein